MQSRLRHHRAKRSKWAHVNTPDGLRRRRAKIDAAREAIAATLPPVDPGPQPGELWQTVVVRVYVPTCAARCDQHALELDGKRVGIRSATQIGVLVRDAIHKRPSVAIQADVRRDEWRAAMAHHADSC